jgi:DNA-binding IscR family transcriptional regulator
MMGEIFLNDCLCRPKSCKRSPTCPTHRVWKKANQQLRNTLKNATIAQISR